MIQEIYQKAIKFAGEKHSDQKVPGTNANYLLHISNVAMEILIAYQHRANFNIELAIQLALLHDTLEDTSTTTEELEEVFGAEVCQGVQALTKNDEVQGKAEKMKDSLERIKNAPLEVQLVKIADRVTNLQKPPSTWGKDKIKKYWEEAILIQAELSGCNDFLDKRLALKIDEYKLYWQ